MHRGAPSVDAIPELKLEMIKTFLDDPGTNEFYRLGSGIFEQIKDHGLVFQESKTLSPSKIEPYWAYGGADGSFDEPVRGTRNANRLKKIRREAIASLSEKHEAVNSSFFGGSGVFSIEGQMAALAAKGDVDRAISFLGAQNPTWGNPAEGEWMTDVRDIIEFVNNNQVPGGWNDAGNWIHYNEFGDVVNFGSEGAMRRSELLQVSHEKFLNGLIDWFHQGGARAGLSKESLNSPWEWMVDQYGVHRRNKWYPAEMKGRRETFLTPEGNEMAFTELSSRLEALGYDQEDVIARITQRGGEDSMSRNEAWARANFGIKADDAELEARLKSETPPARGEGETPEGRDAPEGRTNEQLEEDLAGANEDDLVPQETDAELKDRLAGEYDETPDEIETPDKAAGAPVQEVAEDAVEEAAEAATEVVSRVDALKNVTVGETTTEDAFIESAVRELWEPMAKSKNPDKFAKDFYKDGNSVLRELKDAGMDQEGALALGCHKYGHGGGMD